jgi:hypothetical protein
MLGFYLSSLLALVLTSVDQSSSEADLNLLRSCYLARCGIKVVLYTFLYTGGVGGAGLLGYHTHRLIPLHL